MAGEREQVGKPRGRQSEITSLPGVAFPNIIHYNAPTPHGSIMMDDAIDPRLLEEYEEQTLPYLD